MWATVQALFDGGWHQLKVLVRPRQVTGFLDDQLIQEAALETAEPIYINGKTQIAKRTGTEASGAVGDGAVFVVFLWFLEPLPHGFWVGPCTVG